MQPHFIPTTLLCLMLTRDATDHKTHNSDHITNLSHGLDNFSDQQKNKRWPNISAFHLLLKEHFCLCIAVN